MGVINNKIAIDKLKSGGGSGGSDIEIIDLGSITFTDGLYMIPIDEELYNKLNSNPFNTILKIHPYGDTRYFLRVNSYEATENTYGYSSILITTKGTDELITYYYMATPLFYEGSYLLVLFEAQITSAKT